MVAEKGMANKHCDLVIFVVTRCVVMKLYYKLNIFIFVGI